MTPPALSAARAAMGCLMGMGLGVIYSFLRPLRPRWTGLADLLFLAAFGAAWVYLGFGICGGDLRFGYSASLPVGILLWELTAGRVLRRVFFGFWQIVRKILELLTRPAAKIFQKIASFGKKGLHLRKNRVQ